MGERLYMLRVHRHASFTTSRQNLQRRKIPVLLDLESNLPLLLPRSMMTRDKCGDHVLITIHVPLDCKRKLNMSKFSFLASICAPHSDLFGWFVTVLNFATASDASVPPAISDGRYRTPSFKSFGCGQTTCAISVSFQQSVYLPY